MFAEGEAGNVSAVIERRIDYMSFPYFYGRAVEQYLFYCISKPELDSEKGIGLIECVRQIREETEVRRFIHAVVENFKIKE